MVRRKHHFDLVVFVAIIGALVMLSVVTIRPTSQVTVDDSQASSIAASIQDCCLVEDPSKSYVYNKCLDDTLTSLRNDGVLPKMCW